MLPIHCAHGASFAVTRKVEIAFWAASQLAESREDVRKASATWCLCNLLESGTGPRPVPGLYNCAIMFYNRSEPGRFACARYYPCLRSPYFTRYIHCSLLYIPNCHSMRNSIVFTEYMAVQTSMKWYYSGITFITP